MRVKDEIKQDALFKATVKLVNEIGFASSSVGKIAKEAGISPATVYIYYKNKEDLLVSTYMDIKKNFTQALLKDFDESLSGVDFVAIAVQDHGISNKGMSNRQSRIQNMKALLKDEAAPENLAFKEDEVPPYFLRMQSAVQASRRQLPEAQVLVMDTAPAAILGCLKDPVVEKKDNVIALSIGNGHTMAAIISKGKIQGLMEHHTCILDPKKLELLMVRFADGDLTNEVVFRERGHGLFYLTQPPGFSQIDVIAVTGPNRKLASKTNLPIYFAAPGGDMMMTGPIGLVEATKRKYTKD